MDPIRVKSDREEEEEEEVLPKTINSMSSTMMRLTSRLMLPIGSLIFALIFWVVGLIAYMLLEKDFMFSDEEKLHEGIWQLSELNCSIDLLQFFC